jgi:hypothetical protein
MPEKNSRRPITPPNEVPRGDRILFDTEEFVWVDVESSRRGAQTPTPAPTPARRRINSRKRRLAASLTFTTLFFAGAALSAGAGDAVVSALESTTMEALAGSAEADEAPEDTTSTETTPTETTPTETTPTETTPTEEPPAEEPPAEEPTDPVETGGGSSGGGNSGNGGGSSQPVQPGKPAKPSKTQSSQDGSQSASTSAAPLATYAQSRPAQIDPEVDAPGVGQTIWLHRDLADPTPPARRLTPSFAQVLKHEAERAHVDWAIVLAALRAGGFDAGAMKTATVRDTARELADLGARRSAWRAFLGYRGRTAFADRALALTYYNRAVGLRALVTGLKAARPALERKVLNDPRLDIYAGGRSDIARDFTDVRVLVLLEYLAEAHGQVTVSSLTSGHRIYSRPGTVSAHTYGLAVDIAAVENTAIIGHQAPGGVTERAVRNILLLPAELQARQVISLLAFGGPSFAMGDHHDHIHVGY